MKKLLFILVLFFPLIAFTQSAEDLYASAVRKAEYFNFKGALDDLNEAIALNPRYIKAYTYRGYVKDELDDYKGALADYNTAVSLKGDDYEAYARRGALKKRYRDYDGAIEDLDLAIQYKPDYAKAYSDRGQAKILNGDKKGGCTDMAKAKSLGYYAALNTISTNCK